MDGAGDPERRRRGDLLRGARGAGDEALGEEIGAAMEGLDLGATLGDRGEDGTVETIFDAFGLEEDGRLRYLAELVHEADPGDETLARAGTRGLVFVPAALRRTMPADARPGARPR